MEGGGLAGLLVHVDAGLLQQLVGDQLMVEYNRDAEGGVLDTVDWKWKYISLCLIEHIEQLIDLWLCS